MNAAAAAILGRPSEQLIGLHDRDVLPPDVAAAIEREDERILRGGETIRVEETLFDASTCQLRLFASVKAPLRDSEGAIVGLIGIARDITTRRRNQALIAESRERIRLATEAADIGIWDVDPATGTLRWDDRCRALFGLPANAEVDYQTSFFAALHPDDRPRVEALVMAALHPEGTGEFATEYRIRRAADGAERWLNARGRVHFEGGRAKRFIGTAIDVTDRKRTEEALEDALRAKEALLYEVNHRVKNSLQMIMALLTLQERQSQSAETARDLAVARARIGVVGAIHQSLYTSAAHREVEICGFLATLARSAVASMSDVAHVRLEVETRCEVGVDFQRAIPIALIVSELLTNSLKYAFPDRRSGVLRLLVDQDPAGLLILVEDDGVGLNGGFSLTTPTGVGSRIIATLAKQLAARVVVADAAPGARFTISVPA